MSFCDMSGQVVMISGISGQIGQALVGEVLKNGGKVLGIDISIPEIQGVVSSNGWDKDSIVLSEADIRIRADVEKAFEVGLNKFGKVCNGVSNFKYFHINVTNL